MPATSMLAEQIRAGVAPSAILLASRDVIVTLGALAAAEVYDIRLPILLLDPDAMAGLPRTGAVVVSSGPSGSSVSWF